MLTLATADTIAAQASASSVVNVTIFGTEITTSRAYKVLYQGQPTNSAATLYTVAASTSTEVKSIHVVNTDSVARTLTLYRRRNYVPVVQADSPVAYWRLDDGSGPTVTATVGNNLNANNGPTFGAAGLLTGSTDTAITFISASSTYADASDSGLPSGNGAWSVETWIKTSQAGEVGLVIWGTDNGSSGAACLAMLDGVICFDTATFFHQFGSAVVNDNAPHHIALTWDGTTMLAYKDGAQVGTGYTPGALNLTLGGANKLRIGSRNALYLNGTLDEPAIYSTTLSAARILAHYQAGAAFGAQDQITPAVSIPAGCAATYEDGRGWRLVAGGAIARSDKQVFTATGSWAKPTSFTPRVAAVVAVGAGGGGASGKATNGAVVHPGSTGGGGGGYAWKFIGAADLAPIEAAVVGVGGGGGVGVLSAAGTDGSLGGQSWFGTPPIVTAGGGGGGHCASGTGANSGGSGGGVGETPVTTVSGSTSAGGSNNGGSPKPGTVAGVGGTGGGTVTGATAASQTEYGGAGGGGAAAGTSSGTGSTSIHGGGAGGAGEGTDGTPTLTGAAAGGDSGVWTAAGGGGGAAGTGGASPTAGTGGTDGTSKFAGSGGGGGGGSVTASVNGANGGAGGAVGGGGGGGGAASGTAIGGNGGNGGRGEVRVYCW